MRRSRGRRGFGGAQGGVAVWSGGVGGLGRCCRATDGQESYCGVVASAVGAREEGNSGEVLAAHQGSKCEKKYIGRKRGARRC